MTDFQRKLITVVEKREEKDDEYLARVCMEAHRELSRVYADVSCKSFNGDSHDCSTCRIYARGNIEDFENLGKKYGEKCEMRLALNYLAAVRNMIVTGKP